MIKASSNTRERSKTKQSNDFDTLFRLRSIDLRRKRAFTDGEEGFIFAERQFPSESLRVDFRYYKPMLELSICNEDRIHSSEQTVMTSEEPCHLGGTRTWLHCPESSCRRRSGVLYLNESQWLCRVCARVSYPSQRMKKILRMQNKAKRLRRRLRGDGTLFGDFPDKPQGMHWSTYNESIIEIFQLEVDVLLLRQLETQRIMSSHLGYEWRPNQTLEEHWEHVYQKNSEGEDR